MCLCLLLSFVAPLSPFQSQQAKAMAPKGVEAVAPTSLSCIIMDGKALSAAEVRA